MIATLFVNPVTIPASQAILWLLPLTFGVAPDLPHDSL